MGNTAGKPVVFTDEGEFSTLLLNSLRSPNPSISSLTANDHLLMLCQQSTSITSGYSELWARARLERCASLSERILA